MCEVLVCIAVDESWLLLGMVKKSHTGEWSQTMTINRKKDRRRYLQHGTHDNIPGTW